MSGDYSRHSFDPREHFSAVLMQQGRVALDADWNEMVALFERRLRAETIDIIGRCVVPRETLDGFRIGIGGGGETLTIGRGRIYVHGHLAENHGRPPFDLDIAQEQTDGSQIGVLAEEIGAGLLDYFTQPYLPDPPPLPDGNGPHLVYLDVWQREVTYLEDETLLEKGLGGVDTTTRLQTVWQVKVIGNVGPDATCGAELEVWDELIAPSAGRLSTQAVQVEDPDDPCLIPPAGGYKGLENQLYRLEIHDGGEIGEATFKWSRDNATVATNIVDLPSNDTITVLRVGRDSVLRFNPGDWVEVTDDRREFAGAPGTMLRVVAVDDGTRRITLSAALPADLVPSGSGQDTFPGRHTRIRRWDQRGAVRDTGGNLLVDLDAPASTGVIPVPAAGTSLILENGVQITFDIVPAGGRLRSEDYWNFAARTADASVEILDRAPPRGIHHHYCRLAIATFPESVSDCRVFWPPEFGGGEECACSVCVSAESHNSGVLTIQDAVAQVGETGGTICLGVGVFNLRTGIQIDGGQSVRIVGQGWRTILAHSGNGPAIAIRNGIGVTIEDLSVLVFGRGGDNQAGGGMGFGVRNSMGVTIERCYVVQAAGRQIALPAIGIEGFLLGATFQENLLIAPVGIANTAGLDREDGPRYLLTLNLRIRDNVLGCQSRGVSLDRLALHAGQTVLSSNLLISCAAGGIVASGVVMPGAQLEIAGNSLQVSGIGILSGATAARIEANAIARLGNAETGDGIVLADGLIQGSIEDCQIIGNRITGMPGRGIAITGALRAVMVKQNVIRETGRGGIEMDPESTAEMVTIENNELTDIAPSFNNAQQPIAALRVVSTDEVRIVGNAIGPVAAAAVQAFGRSGIEALGCPGIRVSGNDLFGIGPGQAVGSTDAIYLGPPFQSAQVADNKATRAGAPVTGAQSTDWLGLRIERRPQMTVTGAPGPLTTPVFVSSETATFAVNRRQIRAMARATRSHLSIAGNHLLGFGGNAPVVRVVGADACAFTGNQCFLDGDAKPPAAVIIQADKTVLGNNIVRRLTDQDAVQLAGKQITAVGNITMGNIRWNGSPLPAPWNTLNVLAP